MTTIEQIFLILVWLAIFVGALLLANGAFVACKAIRRWMRDDRKV